MSLSEVHEALVKAAHAAIDAVPKGTAENRVIEHTVGCAALCNDGRVFTGINVFHFAGGPCAENIALANATAAGVASSRSPGVGDGSARLTTIVAVTNDDRGVISPCGRCRQMLLDFYPDIQVIVRDGTERRVVDIDELLPFAFKPRSRPLVHAVDTPPAKVDIP